MPPPCVTCMACNVLVPGVDRTTHYRSDPHRVNLQRKVAGLPPLTLSDFQRRAEVTRQEEAVQKSRRTPRACAVCSKRFSSESALANHIASKRHRDAVRLRAPHLSLEAAALGPLSSPRLSSVSGAALSPVGSEHGGSEESRAVEGDVSFEEEIDMDRRIAEAVPFSSLECCFDGRRFETVEDNLLHMRSFGFFIPFKERLRDLGGLLAYLGQKVGIGYACVECDRSFYSVAAAQQHMIAKGHCRMTADDDVWFEEYGQFYDFGEATGSGSDEEGWEEVGEDEAAAMEADAGAAPQTVVDVDGASKEVVLATGKETALRAPDDDGVDEMQKEEVALVVGNKVIGHRSLHRYYRQKIRGKEERDAVVINKLANEFRMMGWQRKKIPPKDLKAARMHAFQRNKKHLEVGIRNYHTRKAPLRVPMAVFNSGYRP